MRPIGVERIAIAFLAVLACTPAGPPRRRAEPHHVTPIAHTVPAVDAAGCVVDRRTHTASASADLDGLPISRADFEEQSLPDVDGDGARDWAVVAPYRGCGVTGNCLTSVYVSAHGCPRLVARRWLRVDTLEVIPDTGSMHALRNFLSDGCAGLAGRLETLRWRDDRYELADELQCTCPEDDASPRPPACP